MNPITRVLYAEDNPQDAFLTKCYFSKHAPEFEFDVVGTGQECLTRLREARYDVVLLDYLLPDMDGLKVLRMLYSGIRIPVVMVTGVGDENMVVKALRLGASNYVPKQGDYLESLPALLRDVVAEYRLKQERGQVPAPAGRKILYVDHQPAEIERTLRHISESAPTFVVAVARTCAEALTRLGQQSDYDLVLVNLRMPDQSGLDFMREAKRRLVRLPPFIMISEKGDEATAIATLKLGAVDYITQREGYLNHLGYTIEQAISYDRLNRLSEQLRGELAERKRDEEARARLATAVEQVAETIMITSTDGVILYANPAFESITGYTSTEAVGQNCRILKSGRHDAAFYRKMWETLTSGKVWHGRLTNRRKDGSLYEEDATISPVFDAAGRIINYVATKRDITRELALEEQYLQALKMEAVGRLAGGVAHDFNNKLQIILGCVESIMGTLGPDHPIQADLVEIRESARRSAELTRQLLAFSRRQTIMPVPLDVNAALAGSLNMLGRILGKTIQLHMNLPGELWSIYLDPGQLDQILANLVVNARDAMEGGGTVTLEAGNRTLQEADCRGQSDFVPPGEYVVMTIRDTGKGMTPEVLPHVFEPFFTTKRVGEGVGLGLSTVYGIVKQNGGAILVNSEPGRGTEFTLYFPRCRETSEEAVDNEKKTTPAESETVLIVEDEENVLKLAQRQLSRQGYKVLVANTPDDALLLCERYPDSIHLLLSDVIMPGMDGRELSERMRKLRPDIRVLFMSGYSADIMASHGQVPEGRRVLQKPFTSVALAQYVRAALDSVPSPVRNPSGS